MSMSRYKNEKEFMFCERKADEVRLYFIDKQNINIAQIKDEKLNTVLHQSAYQGSFPIMKLYVEHMQKYWSLNNKNNAQISELVKKWINEKNKDGLSCLHYAAFKGNIEILDYLTDLNADYHLKTSQGLGVLHLAGQADKVKTFVFFRGLININQPDAQKSTPLHWAAYSGSQKVVEYLLCQAEIKINLTDNEGQTPLHLATTNGNTRTVRKLLIAGAQRHIKNNENLEPIQIAKDNEFTNIEKLLNDNYSICDHIKFLLNFKTKYMPTTRSWKIPIFFMVLSLIFIVFLSFGTQYHEEYQMIYIIQEVMLGGLLILYFSLLTDPVKLARGSYKQVLKIWLNKNDQSSQKNQKGDPTMITSSKFKGFNQNEVDSICLRCIQYKPERSYHCDRCDVCVRHYDHHCPWINNCVGQHNIIRFNVFIIWLLIVLIWILVVDIELIMFLLHDEDAQLGWFQPNDTLKNMLWLVYAFVVFSFPFCLIFHVLLFCLVFVHIKNLLTGQTTHERFSKANQSVLTKSISSFAESNRDLSIQSEIQAVKQRKLYKKEQEISCQNCKASCCNLSSQDYIPIPNNQ